MHKHFEQTMQGGLANARNFNVTAKLYWGGTQQDRTKTTLYFNYQPAGF